MRKYLFIRNVTWTLPRDRYPCDVWLFIKITIKSRNERKHFPGTSNNMYTKFYVWLIFSFKIIEKVYVILDSPSYTLVWVNGLKNYLSTYKTERVHDTDIVFQTVKLLPYKMHVFLKLQFVSHCYTLVWCKVVFRLWVYIISAIYMYLSPAKVGSFCKICVFRSTAKHVNSYSHISVIEWLKVTHFPRDQGLLRRVCQFLVSVAVVLL